LEDWMRASDRKPLYRHVDVALLRAAAAPLTDTQISWPDLTDTAGCRRWLEEMWSRPALADAVRQASPSLGDGVDAIHAGHTVGDKQIRSATLSTMRYLLRSIGRPTPFGLFAGVAPLALAGTARADWGEVHRGVARANTGWLADIITRLERCPELLERLHVVVTDLAVRRGGRLEVPQGPNRVTIRCTRAVTAVTDLAATPAQFGAVVDTLAEDFSATRSAVRDMLTELVGRTEARRCAEIIDLVLRRVRPVDSQRKYTLDPGVRAEATAAAGELCRAFPLRGYPTA
jgi:lantibiotic biosynthesis protein